MINIVYCGNDRIFDGLLTCSLSIVKRRIEVHDITFYVLTMDLTQIDPLFKPVTKQQIDFLNTTFKKYGNIEFKLIDLTETYRKELLGNPNENTFCSPYTLLRILADLCPELPDKVLYLDVDILFNGDVNRLYKHNVENYDFAGVPDDYAKIIAPKYVNAGVLLLNLKRIRESGYFVRVRKIINSLKLIWADQDAINLGRPKKKILSQKYNEIKDLNNEETIIRHFSKRLVTKPHLQIVNIKQWNIDAVHQNLNYHGSDDILEEYIAIKKEYSKLYPDNLVPDKKGKGKY